MKKPKQKKNKQNRQTKMTMLVRPKLLTLAIAQALAFQTANAATIEVTSSVDDGTGCTLREAITTVNHQAAFGGCAVTGSLGSNDTINFASNVSGGTITLTSSGILLNNDMSINPNGGETTIRRTNAYSMFYGNNTTGGITVELNNLIITGADQPVHVLGGGIDLVGSSSSTNTLTLNHCTITGNKTVGRGGGIYSRLWTVNLNDSTVSGNMALVGGGLFAYSYNSSTASMTLTNSTVSSNLANFNGGGMFVFSSSGTTSVTLTDSTVSGNSANYGGGGLFAYSYNSGTASMTLTNSTVSGNSANNGGGGLYVHSYDGGTASVMLTSSTVSGNIADDGSGIFVYGYDGGTASVVLTSSTVSGNIADDGGGVFVYGYDGGTASVTLANSIVANTLGGDDCALVNATATAGADNIIESDSCGTSAQTIDPGLMPLAANGGPTETHALMPGSPAIDGGDQAQCVADLSPLEDQRGEARNDGACDIGAYEFNATLIPIARKDRKMGSFMNGGEQWYSFNSTESQKLSMQTNGFSGDTLLEYYTGTDPKQVNPKLNMDDDGGPDLFSNIKHNVNSGPYLIRVKGKTDVIPYWLRLMSDKDILSFGDTASHFANKEIRVMSSAGITGGCGVNKYCPTDPVTRAQMAIFMLKAILGGNHNSPPASGSVFSDVGTSSFGASFIEEFSTLGITSGCGGGKYCPDLAVTREQMAVFLLRAWYGSSYTPPAATPAEINQFGDIANSFAKDWIVQLTKENITGGCGGDKFCPTDTVTRGQMAAFITRTFDLDVKL